MKIIETKVFQYSELSPEAQSKARDWYRSCNDGDSDFAEFVIEDSETCANLIGIEFDSRQVPLMNGKTRGKPCVWWSGFSSQGDGACFEGRWDASDVKPGKLKEHAPQDSELHRIAAEFERIAAEFPESSFTVKHSGHYQHSRCTYFDVVSGDYEEDGKGDKFNSAADDLIEVARDFMDWIFRQLETAYEYENSDECVTDNITANEYEFTEDRSRF